jgi:hypothetical protein
MRVSIAAAAAALLFGTPACAQGWTGNDLLTMCQDTNPQNPTISKGMCLGYVTGAYETYSETLPQIACTGNGVTGQQLMDIVVKFLLLNPEKRNKGAALLVGAALADAFPCQNSKLQ